MQEYEEYKQSDFIIWNSQLGVRDFVTIGEINSDNKTAYLDEPYEMVGPFCLDTLCCSGQISFESCIVMSKNYWDKNRITLQAESIIKQRKLQEELYKEINQNNNRKKHQQTNKEKEHRELLCLPLVGLLEVSQIKTAYKKIVKKVHPDLGGSHEEFIQITNAKDSLLETVA